MLQKYAVPVLLVVVLALTSVFAPVGLAKGDNGTVSHTATPEEQNYQWTLERMLMATPMPMTGEERQFLSTHPNLDEMRSWSFETFKKYVTPPLGNLHCAQEFLRWRDLDKMISDQAMAAARFLKQATPPSRKPSPYDSATMEQVQAQLKGADAVKVYEQMKIWREDIAVLAPKVESYRDLAKSKGVSDQLEQVLAQ
jgi:hypothetical protein